MSDEVTEQMRIEAIPQLMDWSRNDQTVRILVNAVQAAYKQPSIGHLARFHPQAFDDLFEEASGIMQNED